MTIKSRVWINTVSMLALACLIAVIAQWSIKRVESVNEQEHLALNFIERLCKLTLLEYFGPSEPPLEFFHNQRLVSHATLQRLLDQLQQAATPEQQVILNKIRTEQSRYEEIFSTVKASSLIQYFKDTKAVIQQAPIVEEITALKTTIVSDSLLLTEQLHNQGRESILFANWLITGTTMVFGLLAVTLAWLFSWNFQRGVRMLRHGLAQIGAGQFDYRIDIRFKDEFGDIAQALNRMGDQLAQSYRDLRKEIAEKESVQQALRESEQRFSSMADAAQDAIIMINDRDQIEYWNPAAERILGYSRDEALGKALHEWLAPESFRADYKRGSHRFVTSGRGAIIGKTRELVALRKGGEEFPVELSVSSLKLKGHWYALGVLRDITARKRTERLLKEAEACWRLLLNSTGEGIYGVDLNDRCTFVNPACLRMLGYQHASSLLGKNIHPLIHHTRPDGAPYPSEECQVYQSYRLEKKVHVDDEVFWRKDGTCFPVEYRARPLKSGNRIMGCVVTFVDITERKRTEEALRRERDFAKSLIETAQVIVLVLDTEGRILQFNHFMEQLSGYRLEDVRGQYWCDTFLPEQNRERSQQVFQKAVSNIPTTGQVDPIITRSRHLRFIEWYGTTLKNVDGQVIGVLTIGHDITEHKAQEAQLLQAQKMEVVGQLTGGIAHDFNNLLTIILGNLDFLSSELGKEAAPKIQEPLEDAFSAARDAAELTQRLLALSRRQALKPNYIGLDKVVRNLKKFLRRILGEQFELHLNTPNDILTVFADPSRLENALLNLIINARDAMPRGGTLTIDIFRKTLPASDVGSSDLRPGSYAVMKITDTGTGMSQEVLSRAIEPFFTTKTSGKGTGLGLSMVYSFAKQSGGDLRLESKPEIGTSVSLLLPETEPVKEDSVMETQLGISQGSSETILIVEDEPRVRKLLTRRLRNFGYRVIECENAQSAKEIIESQADVDLLFSDIVMPGNMDGYELVGWVQEKRPELKLLLTTGADSRSGMRDESIPVLRKPYTEKMLQDTIRSLFDDKNKVTNLHDR